MQAGPVKTRFVALDGLRGVAALSVALSHLFHGSWVFPSAHVAVDFFFILSGFVIAGAYDERLVRGLGFQAFAAARVRRLYPLLGFAAILGLMAQALLFALGRSSMSLIDIGVAFARAAVVLPQPEVVLGGAGDAFPLDPPTWSLLFEILVSLGYAALIVATRRYPRPLVALAALTVLAVTMATIALIEASGLQWRQPYLAELTRAGFAFMLGALLSRLRGWKSLPSLSLGVLSMLVLTIVSLAPPEGWRPLFENVCLCWVFPLLVLAGAQSTVSGGAQTFARWSGEISYPMYLLHVPISALVLTLGGLIVRGFAGQVGLVVVVDLAAVVCVSLIALRLVDEPLRGYRKPQKTSPVPV